MAKFRALTVLLSTAAVIVPGVARASTLNVLDVANRLVSVDSAAPGTITNTVVLTGLNGNETLLGIDYRPASSRVLYGISTVGQLYAINPRTGAATAVGTPNAVFGTAAGVDFNPAVDRLRVVSNTNQNLRINPANGALAATDTPLAYAAGDAGAGSAPRVVAAAYSNNVAGATPTTLYVIDANRGVLATQGNVGGTVSPNTGQLFTVGALGVAGNDTSGFDIGRDGTVLATFTQPGTATTSLYSVNLITGATTLVGVVGTAGHGYTGLAIAPPTIASYGVTANQIAVGSALDNFVGVPSAALDTAFNSLDSLTPAGRAAALSQLTPAAYSLLPQVALQTVDFTEETLRRYLRDFRAGGTGGVAQPGDRKFGSFLVGSGRYGHFDAAVDRPRIEVDAASVEGGIDYRFGPRSLIGVTGGYDAVHARLGDAVPDSTIKNYFGGAYATIGIGPLYVDGFGTYGKADYDLRRGVDFGATSLAFGAATHSKTYVGGGTAGLSFNAAGFEFEPFAGARYAKIKLDGLSEGTGFGALTLGRRSYQSVVGTAGVRVGAAFTLGGAVVRPEVRGSYRHEFQHDDGRGFTFGFGGVGADASRSLFTPTALRRNYYTAGAGFTVSNATSPISLVVDYNGQYDKDRSINGITGGLRYSF